MSETEFSASVSDIKHVPVRNIWHMFVYAWDLLDVRDKFKASTEAHPSAVLMIASVLADALRLRLRYPLQKEYVSEQGEIGAIRGRVDILRSVRTQAFERGRVFCKYQSFSPDNFKNQAVKATINLILQDRTLRTKAENITKVRNKLNRSIREMADVSNKPITVDAFRRINPDRNNPFDRVVLSLCELYVRAGMPLEGSQDTSLLSIDKEIGLLRKVYERFVGKFLAHHLEPHGWTVWVGKRFEWPAGQATEGFLDYVPHMITDIVLIDPDCSRSIIIDTKFTNMVTKNQHENETFKTNHLYQIFTYLKTQRLIEGGMREAMLLYPAINHSISERAEVLGDFVRMETVDLSQPWQDIENELVGKFVGAKILYDSA